MSLTELEDRRAIRTRQAVMRAFVDLVLDRRYDEIRVVDIIARADVGRSTFYEHYRGKDDVLLQSMGGLLDVLAASLFPDGDEAALQAVVEHFWENRRFARRLLFADRRPMVVQALARRIEARIAGPHGLHPRLLANQLAAGQLGLLESWLAGDASASPAEIARALRTALRP